MYTFADSKPQTDQHSWARSWIDFCTFFFLTDLALGVLYPVHAGFLAHSLNQITGLKFTEFIDWPYADHSVCRFGWATPFGILFLVDLLPAVVLSSLSLIFIVHSILSARKKTSVFGPSPRQMPVSIPTQFFSKCVHGLRFPLLGGLANVILYFLVVFPTYNLAEAICYQYQLHTSLLLLMRAEVEGKDHHGWTPLIYATQNEDRQMIEELLRRSAWIDTTNSHGETPLWISASRHRPDLCQLFLDAGARVDHPDSKGYPPLLAALDEYCYNDYITDYRPLDDQIKQRQKHQTVMTLVRAGAAVTGFQTPERKTIADLAAEVGEYEIFKLAISQKPSEFDQISCAGNYLLFKAIENDDLELVQLLIDKGMMINLENSAGKSPLEIACQSQKPHAKEITSVLLNHGAVFFPVVAHEKPRWSPPFVSTFRQN